MTQLILPPVPGLILPPPFRPVTRRAWHRMTSQIGAGLSKKPAPAAGFTPPQTDIWAHWDPADTASITESSGLVSQIDDQTGNGRHLVESDSADQMSTNTELVNGNNVLEVLNDDEHMTLGTSYHSWMASFGIYWGMQVDAVSGASNSSIGVRDNAFNGDGFSVDASTASDYYGVIDDRGGIGGDLTPSSTSRIALNWWGVTFDSGGARRILYNGSVIASDSNYNGAISSTNTFFSLNGIRSGTPPAVSSELDECIYLDVLVYSDVPSGSTETDIGTFFDDKWGL